MSQVKPPTARAVILGGLVPVIAYTLIEEFYGIVAGLIAGMIFGLAEIIWEKWKDGRVQKFTLGANGLILGLGLVSLVTQEGLWFKLQPAILEALFAAIFIGSVLIGKPIMTAIAEKQAAIPPRLKEKFRGLTFRVGIFFAIHAGLAAWAAIYASTRTWALLKGVGFTGSFIAYLVVETLYLRYRIRQS